MFFHIDIDSFFVSAERRKDPRLNGIPVAVGSRSNVEIFNTKRMDIRLMDKNQGAFVAPVFHAKRSYEFEDYFVDSKDGERKVRGIITTSSYEARAKGVKTGMPIAIALSHCPELKVIVSDYPYYHMLSHQIHQFMRHKFPQVQQYSIDEFFASAKGWVDDDEALLFAKQIQKEIYEHFAIPVSIGISKAKWIAKLATSYAKPYGVYKVDDIKGFVSPMKIEKFPGIGSGFSKRLRSHYIYTLGDLIEHKKLLYSWKLPGKRLYDRVVGECGEEIEPKEARKSIGISRTFDSCNDYDELLRRVMVMARYLLFIAHSIEQNPTIYTLKINYSGGYRAKESFSIDRPFSERLFKKTLREIYGRIALKGHHAYKLSVLVSRFSQQQRRAFDIFGLESDMRDKELSYMLYELRLRFGIDIIKSADEL